MSAPPVSSNLRSKTARSSSKVARPLAALPRHDPYLEFCSPPRRRYEDCGRGKHVAGSAAIRDSAWREACSLSLLHLDCGANVPQSFQHLFHSCRGERGKERIAVDLPQPHCRMVGDSLGSDLDDTVFGHE